MTEIDRRAFLQITGMLAAGAFAENLKAMLRNRNRD